MEYRAKFLENLPVSDVELLKQVVHSPNLIEAKDILNKQYADGINAWPLDIGTCGALINKLEAEAIDQITRLKQDVIITQKRNAGLIKTTAVAVYPEQYAKLKKMSMKSGLPITKIIGLMIDKFADKIRIEVTIQD